MMMSSSSWSFSFDSEMRKNEVKKGFCFFRKMFVLERDVRNRNENGVRKKVKSFYIALGGLKQ